MVHVLGPQVIVFYRSSRWEFFATVLLLVYDLNNLTMALFYIAHSVLIIFKWYGRLYRVMFEKSIFKRK